MTGYQSTHNYYLYEYDGQLNIFPWDYNLSLGGMSSMGSDADATEVVNDAIDTPFSGTKFFDALLSNEEYLEKYHAYLRQLVDEYVNGGRFDEVYNRIRSQIDPLVETDPTAFYPYDEYETAEETLYETVKLRAESISGQLDGTIPSTDAGQRQDTSSRVDASHIDLSVMGRFSMGGTGDFKGRSDRIGTRLGKRGESSPDNGTQENTQEEQPPESTEFSDQPGGSGSGSMPDMGSFNPGSMPDMGSFNPGSMPDMGNFDPGSMPDMGNFNPGSMPDMGSFNPGSRPDTGTSDSGSSPSVPSTEDAASAPSESPDASQGQKNRLSSFSGRTGQSSAKTNNIITLSVCLGIMLAALAVVSGLKRRRKK